MKRLLLFFFLLPFVAAAHPGIAIVTDSKGNIYYSDLQQVFKIADGKKTVAVPRVHTHELHIDAQDNLYGEHQTNTTDHDFFHYLWVLRPDGRLDTIMDQRKAFQQVDFSLARDRQGNEYYVKLLVKEPDTAHIYKKTPDGRETVFAKGNFKGVVWLHPQTDGSLLFVQKNDVYRVLANGQVTVLAKNIGSNRPTFSYSRDNTIWGLWQDKDQNVYVAVFSEQKIKKIGTDGSVTDFYTSKDNWTPVQAVVDPNGQMWLMETNDKNVIRVLPVPALVKQETTVDDSLSVGLIAILIGVGGFFLYRYLKRKR